MIYRSHSKDTAMRVIHLYRTKIWLSLLPLVELTVVLIRFVEIVIEREYSIAGRKEREERRVESTLQSACLKGGNQVN